MVFVFPFACNDESFGNIERKPEPGEVLDEPHMAKVTIFLNIALCQLKQEKYYEARKTVGCKRKSLGLYLEIMCHFGNSLNF